MMTTGNNDLSDSDLEIYRAWHAAQESYRSARSSAIFHAIWSVALVLAAVPFFTEQVPPPPSSALYTTVLEQWSPYLGLGMCVGAFAVSLLAAHALRQFFLFKRELHALKPQFDALQNRILRDTVVMAPEKSAMLYRMLLVSRMVTVSEWKWVFTLCASTAAAFAIVIASVGELPPLFLIAVMIVFLCFLIRFFFYYRSLARIDTALDDLEAGRGSFLLG